MNRFERFFAFRYLRRAQGREEGRGFLRFILAVAIGGVTVGVAALLLALSIVRGFSKEIEAKIVGFGAHVQVESYRDAPLNDADRLAQSFATMAHVQAVAPVVIEFALIRHGATEIDGALLWGTPSLPSYLANHVVAGEGHFAETDGLPGLVVGKKLAAQLKMAVGERITLISARTANDGQRVGGLPVPRFKQFIVTGIYETSLTNFDELYVFTDLTAARQLMQYQADEVTRFDLTLDDAANGPTVVAAIEEAHGFPLLPRTIYDVFRSLFAWVNLQEGIIPVVIGAIILVAAFNIVGALLMIILEKTNEIGVLASLGASQKMIRRLFLALGLLIGGIGTFLGELLALALAWLQLRYALIPLPEEAYYMKSAPIALNPLDFVMVALLALALCVTAAYIPARIAARLEPIRVIRFR